MGRTGAITAFAQKCHIKWIYQIKILKYMGKKCCNYATVECIIHLRMSTA